MRLAARARPQGALEAWDGERRWPEEDGAVDVRQAGCVEVFLIEYERVYDMVQLSGAWGHNETRCVYTELAGITDDSRYLEHKIGWWEIERDLRTNCENVNGQRDQRSGDGRSAGLDSCEHEFGDLSEPANYKAALLDPESDKWLNAMNVEMQSMKDNKVWDLVDLPPHCEKPLVANALQEEEPTMDKLYQL
ncbi:hypothetical protein Tco_1008384 [Tanacetum coccineum]